MVNILRRFPILAAVLAVVLAACGQQPGPQATAPDGYVSIDLGLAASSLASQELVPQGAPYDSRGAIAFDTVDVQVLDKSGNIVEFIEESGSYTADPTGSVDTITLSGSGGSSDTTSVTLLANDRPFTFVSKGLANGDVIAYESRSVDVDVVDTVRIELTSVLGGAVLTPRYPTNIVFPGQELDLMLVVMANGHAAFATGEFLQVPTADFTVEYAGSPVNASIVSSSERGLRIRVGDACTSTVAVTGEVTGLLSTFEQGSISIAMDGIACPDPRESGVLVDIEPPVIEGFSYDASSGVVTGTASDDFAISEIRINDGPIVLASTHPDGAGVDLVEFDAGTTTFRVTLSSPPAGGVSATAVDSAGNETTTADSFNPDFVYVQEGATGNGSPESPFGTINEAITAVNANGTVYVLEGLYAESLDINKPLSLVGESEGAVTIAPNTGDYGLDINADDVSLQQLTIRGGPLATNYGVKVGKHDVSVLTGLTMSDVSVTGFGKTEVDLNTVQNATLTRVTADGGDTSGVGFALSGVNGIALIDVVAMNNNWGGVGLYTTNVGTINGVSNVHIGAGSQTSVYVDNEFGHEVANLRLDGFEYATFAPEAACPGAGQFTFYFETSGEAVAAADAVCAGAYVQALTKDASGFIAYDNRFLVGNGMSIQAAVDAASVGGIVEVSSGSYSEDVVLDAAVSVMGPNDGVSPDGVRSSEAVIEGNVVISSGGVVVSGFTLQGFDAYLSEKAAFYLADGADAVISNNIVDGSTNAGAKGVVSVSTGSAGADIRDNAFTNLNNGTIAQGDATFVIDGNRFEGNVAGSSTDGGNVTITGNTYVGNDEGIGLGAAAVTVTGNTFDGNVIHVQDWTGTHDLTAILGANTFVGGGSVATVDGREVIQD